VVYVPLHYPGLPTSVETQYFPTAEERRVFNCAHWQWVLERYHAVMWKNISRAQLVGAWVMAVAVLTACGVVLGLDVTLSSATLLVAISLAPPVVLLLVWRGAPPFTVAELLHSVDTSKEGRP
jgi:hypothetical protein